jgi:5'-nucleotidase
VRILVTNDDGIDSVGLHVLARAMRPHGDVVVIAPDREFSGASAAVGALHLSYPEARREHVDGIYEAWSLTGPPALCVMFARLGAFGAPFDLVVSGINPGANVGRSVYHSGTIGATLSGRIGNISGVAVSQSVTAGAVEGQAWDEMIVGQQWDTAASVASAYVGGLINCLPDDAVVVNLNVPNCPVEEIRGWRHTRVGRDPQRPVAAAELVPMVGHDGAYRVMMSWGEPLDLPPDTDGGAVEVGYVSISYLSRLHEIDRPDLADAEKALTGLVPAAN